MSFASGWRSAAGRAATCCFVIGGPRGLDLEARHAALARADDAAAPARPRGAARAALPGPQDPRPRAVSLLNALSLRAVSDPVVRADAAPSSEAAADLRGDGPLRRGQARPAAAGRLRRLLDQRGDAARPDARRAAARDRRAARGDARRAARRRRRARRDRRARLPQPVHDRRLVPRLARRACCAAGGRLRRRRRAIERVQGRVRERQPDRPDHRRRRLATPRTATRWRASSSAPATRVEREYYVNDAGSQVRASASRSGRGPAARSRRRTATRATTCAEPGGARSPARPTPTRTSWPGAGSS